MVWGFWGGFGGPKGRKSGAGGPDFRAPEGPEILPEGPEIRAPEGPEIRPEGPEIRAPEGPGTGPTPFFSFSHVFRFFYLFFYPLSKFQSHVEVGSSSKEPAFDLFARVGRRGGSKIEVEGLKIDVPSNKKRTPTIWFFIAFYTFL